MQSDAKPGQRDFYSYRLLGALVVAVVVFLLSSFLPFSSGSDPYAAKMAAAITALVATIWLTNAVSLGAASLIPIALMPLCGVLPLHETASSYAHPIIWLFFGGFVLALGVERFGLHQRIALNILVRFGVNPRGLVLGFMLSSAFLSMWIMNTATALLLLPIALALEQSLSETGCLTKKNRDIFAFALLVGIAYASSIGGMATPIGTAPNLLFLSNYATLENKGAPPFSFLTWMIVGGSVALVMIPTVWLVLCRCMGRAPESDSQMRTFLTNQVRALAPMDHAEKRMLGLFSLAVLLWVTRQDVMFGSVTIPGWWNLLPIEHASHVGAGGVAVLVAVLAFLIPSGRQQGQALMDWKTAKKVPWDILFLFGAGIAIARAFDHTGLTTSVGLCLKPVMGLVHPIVLVLAVCLLMTFLTEFTSNTAMTAIMLPVLIGAGLGAGMDPRLLMIPATFSASCAFMLPIATPPNAIVFSSGRIPIVQMAKTGFFINLLGAVIITALVWLVAVPVLEINTSGLPGWAK